MRESQPPQKESGDKSPHSKGVTQITLDSKITQLANTPAGSLHDHPTPSPDGKQSLSGSKRDGVRRLFMMNLADRGERQRTGHNSGRAVMWPHWQPVACCH